MPDRESALKSLIGSGGTVALSCPTATTIPFTSTITVGSSEKVTLDASASPGKIILDGGNAVQLLSVERGNLTLDGLTLTHGHSDYGGALSNDHGTLVVKDSMLSGNAASSGGAVGNGGSTTIAGSTLTDNSAVNAAGAAINGGGADSVLTIADSTVTNNSAARAGGIFQVAPGPTTVTNSTIAGNSALTGANLVAFGGSLDVRASIVAGAGGGGANCGGTLHDSGYNLEDDPAATCGFSKSAHDTVGQSPDLGPLADAHGVTQTMALGPGSPAVDRIPTTTGLCPPTDQRGARRPDGSEGTCDIGAFELWDSCPLTDAALKAWLAGSGDGQLDCPFATAVKFSGTIEVTHDLTLDASRSPGAISFDGGGAVRLFVNFAHLTLKHLTLTGGHASNGGAV
ncbi:MAG: hypothetical protein JOY89_05245, partial [Solirubrobacterales bacterium]|nr:hypothetical protein [Solirubrobacterales bacterium]